MKAINDILISNGFSKATQVKKRIATNSKVNQYGSFKVQMQDNGEGYRISKTRNEVSIFAVSERGAMVKIQILKSIYNTLKDQYNCILNDCNLIIKL